MPVSGVSGALSTSIYFVSLFLLLATLIPPTRAAYDDADLAAARHLAGALAQQIDDLSPGMTSALKFGSSPGVSTSVLLSGRNVTATVGGSSATAGVVWQLPTSLLSADDTYVVSLDGGALEVA